MLLDMEFSPDEAELATIGMLGLWGEHMAGLLDVAIVNEGGGTD